MFYKFSLTFASLVAGGYSLNDCMFMLSLSVSFSFLFSFQVLQSFAYFTYYRFCGSDPPSRIQSDSNILYVYFTSNSESSKGTGFNASFSLINGKYNHQSIGTASANYVELGLGCTSRIYLDNVTLTLQYVRLTSHKPCRHFTSVIQATETVINEVQQNIAIEIIHSAD